MSDRRVKEWKLRRPAHPNVYWPDQWDVVSSDPHTIIVFGDIWNQVPPGSANWKPHDSQGRPIGDPYRMSRTDAAQAVFDRAQQGVRR